MLGFGSLPGGFGRYLSRWLPVQFFIGRGSAAITSDTYQFYKCSTLSLFILPTFFCALQTVCLPVDRWCMLTVGQGGFGFAGFCRILTIPNQTLHPPPGMTRSEIATRLREDYKRFAVMISSQADEDFVRAEPGQWTPGHQLDHIYRSVRPLRMAVQLPAFVPRLLFGKAKQPSRTYEEVVARYKDKLASGAKATRGYIPKEVTVANRNRLLIKMTDTVESLAKRIEKMDEDKLDTILLPHPILGKLTLREMLYFTIYHVGHHHKSTLKNLGK